MAFPLDEFSLAFNSINFMESMASLYIGAVLHSALCVLYAVFRCVFSFIAWEHSMGCKISSCPNDYYAKLRITILKLKCLKNIILNCPRVCTHT